MEEVIVERPQPAIAVVRLNRPEARNALSQAVRQRLAEHFQALGRDEDVRCIVLTGGDKVFAAGADIRAMVDATPIDILLLNNQRMWQTIASCPKPVIAAVNGFALGGGCELAMACHIRYAAPHAKFGQPEVKLGLIPGYGGTVRLPRLVGRGVATELLLSGRMIDAAEAERIGLVNRVVAAESLLEECRGLAQTILGMGPIAVGLTLDQVDRALDVPMDQALALEAEAFGAACASEDKAEGTAAFLEKRAPSFPGR